jgi:hypothetical protein
MHRALALLLLLVGCHPVLRTKADGAHMFGTTICEKQAQCGALRGATFESCRAGYVQATCLQIDCSLPINPNTQKIYDCDDAYRAMDCPSFLANLTPLACLP